jgi:hypothetical protein
MQEQVTYFLESHGQIQGWQSHCARVRGLQTRSKSHGQIQAGGHVTQEGETYTLEERESCGKISGWQSCGTRARDLQTRSKSHGQVQDASHVV